MVEHGLLDKTHLMGAEPDRQAKRAPAGALESPRGRRSSRGRDHGSMQRTVPLAQTHL